MAQEWSGQGRIIRVMPNTPSAVGEAASGKIIFYHSSKLQNWHEYDYFFRGNCCNALRSFFGKLVDIGHSSQAKQFDT